MAEGWERRRPTQLTGERLPDGNMRAAAPAEVHREGRRVVNVREKG